MRVLFVRLSHTIDVINTLPAVCAFRRDRPDAWIVYATHSEANIDIVNSCQSVNECLAVPDLGGEDPEEGTEESDEPQSRGKQLFASLKSTAKKTLAGAKSSAEFVKHLHTLELDAVIDLEVSVRSALVARNCGAGLVFGFRSENANSRSAALAYGQAPYVNPAKPDHEKYNILISKSLGTSAFGGLSWDLPSPGPDADSTEIQAIPTGLISPNYWTGVLTSLAQHGHSFSLVDCPLTDQGTLSKIVNGMRVEESAVRRVTEKTCEHLVDNGGPVIADGPAAYLSVALGLDTMAVGEQASSPLIAPRDRLFPGPKDLPYPEIFVERVIEMVKRKTGEGAAATEGDAGETAPPADGGADGADAPQATEPEEGRREPLVFRKTDE